MILHNEMANAIRMLAADAVQTANSGHPGAPMGMAEMAVALWGEHLAHNPADPAWPNRDRFVLSNGHASMLVYALLHLTGYKLPMDELKRFRQLHSKTPGHPEAHITPGVETTTGPLGQGLANAVGMALAEKLMADRFNQDDFPVVDHHTYCFVGDGCLMEGISHEACSLAGALELGKLIVMYDSNGISIDGQITPWFADDTAERFRAYGWHVIEGIDGHDVDAVSRAIAGAKSTRMPSFLVCNTHIGAGSPNRVNTARAHGEPLGENELKLVREQLNWASAPFVIPEKIRQAWDNTAKGEKAQATWARMMHSYAKAHPDLYNEFNRRQAGELPDDFEAKAASHMAQTCQQAQTMATRKASQNCLNALAPDLPELLGGSADLTGSNLTNFTDCGAVRAGEKGGRHINYGVREFAMTAIMNGLALHGGIRPYGGTFAVFSDYSRNAIRMSALMRLPVVHVLTHDSIGLGEDGPTHQPIEHAWSLRAIPDLDTWRPCDALETSVAWVCALRQRKRPSALLLSRQNLPAMITEAAQQLGAFKGGYSLYQSETFKVRVLLIATGSEVHVARIAAAQLESQNIGVRIVSMPCTNLFDRQSQDYRAKVLMMERGDSVLRVAIEAGCTQGWWKYVGFKGDVMGIDTFGESAPAVELFQHFGLTAQHVVNRVLQRMERNEPANTEVDDVTL
ncbi:MAG: transketolase [Limnobacter sp.]|uniref:transketolase n=1 Tax=Limnobacter sp. TaxID=2003368 RepID=UPI00273533FC|nr:transketolase [Limnobacter sp.]MDP3188525.1 transketolase [Limnobacter sp.]